MRVAAPFLIVVSAAVLTGCGAPASTSVKPLADIPSSSSATATSSTSVTPTTSATPTSTTPAVAAGAGVGVGSAADEAVARRAVRAAVPTTSRKATTQKAAPKPAPTTAKKTAEKKAASAYYKNCAAVQAAGAAPIHRGDPGYGSHLDRDGDGKGCAGD